MSVILGRRTIQNPRKSFRSNTATQTLQLPICLNKWSMPGCLGGKHVNQLSDFCWKITDGWDGYRRKRPLRSMLIHKFRKLAHETSSKTPAYSIWFDFIWLYVSLGLGRYAIANHRLCWWVWWILAQCLGLGLGGRLPVSSVFRASCAPNCGAHFCKSILI